MEEVKASENVGLLVPENDSQELWQLEGRVEAIRAICRAKAADGYHSLDIDLLLAMLGDNK